LRKITILLIIIAGLPISVFAYSEAVTDTSARRDAFSKSLAHFTMGIIYDNEARPEAAIAEYKKVLAVEPDTSYVHTRIAADYLLTKREGEAAEELRTAKRLDSQDARARFLLALVYT